MGKPSIFNVFLVPIIGKQQRRKKQTNKQTNKQTDPYYWDNNRDVIRAVLYWSLSELYP
jgi:hypothetical protein